MILVMITLCRRAALLILATLLAPVALPVARALPTPYNSIVERNPFGLRPPPPPVVETNTTETAPPVKVVLTGITSMFGPNSKRAFLEITEEPGKSGKPGAPVAAKRPMLGEGDREGDVEVLAINIEQNTVKIRNGGVESELTFEVPKPSPATPTPTGNMAGRSALPTPAP